MNQEERRGTFTFSLDLADEAGNPQFPHMAKRVLDLANRLSIATTWALPSPAHPLCRSLASHPSHEIAWLVGNGDQSIERADKNLRAFRQQGLNVTTIVMADSHPADLARLGNHGISILREPLTAVPSVVRAATPQVLRFGLWKAPVSVALGTQSRWKKLTRLTNYRSSVKRLALSGEHVHIGVDLAAVDQPGGPPFRQLRKLFDLAAELSHEELAECLTLRDVGRNRQRRSESRPADSILRVA